MNLTLILTVAPPLLIVAYIIKADKFPEPTGLCISTFLLGCLLCIPAASLNNYFIPDLSYAYLAGFTEESLKFAAIYFYIRKKTDFKKIVIKNSQNVLRISFVLLLSLMKKNQH